MTVVFDTNVVVEAIFWPRSNARRALTGLARRRFRTVVNSVIVEEYHAITAELRQKLFLIRNHPVRSPGLLRNPFMWIQDPVPLHGRISRDPKDNVFVATAMAAGAEF